MNFLGTINYQNYISHYNINNEHQTFLTPEATRNLQIAENIVEYVKDAVPFSHNNHIRGQIFTNHHSRESFLVVAGDLSKRYNEFKDATELNDPQEDWEMLATDIVKLRVGACLELSIVGYAYGIQKLNLRNIEIFEMENGDHDFLVIDRDPRSNPNDYKQWGALCIVCDPWLETCYPSSQIESKLYEYSHVTECNGRSIPHLVSFNPNHHLLNLILSSIPQGEDNSLEKMKISFLLEEKI